MVSTSNLTKGITHDWTHKIWVHRVLSYMWIKNNVRNKPKIPHVIMNERSWSKREISINYKIQFQCHIITLVKSSVINYDCPSGPLGLCLGCNVGQGKGYNRVSEHNFNGINKEAAVFQIHHLSNKSSLCPNFN